MIEPGAEESNCIGMAVFARIAGYEVIRGHRSGYYPRPPGVASGTVARCALEYATDVAGTAVGIKVCSRQGEAGFKMVEIVKG